MQHLTTGLKFPAPIFLIILVTLSIQAQEQKKDLPARPPAITTPSPSKSAEQQSEDALDAMASWTYSTYQGRVSDIIDGNTITVVTGNKKRRVRLLGVGVPEKGQPLADKSRAALSRLLNGKTVEVLAIPQEKKVDDESLLSGKVLLESTDAGLEQIRTGFAWLSDESQNYQTHKDRRLYAEAEQSAADKMLGFWSRSYRCADDSIPTATNPSSPRQSGETKVARVSGTVLVEVLIDESGKVISAKAICGHPMLRQASVQAAYKARFSQTFVSGAPVRVTGIITYKFVAQ
jgi:endonuclease YncB( thermonuclease family)